MTNFKKKWMRRKHMVWFLSGLASVTTLLLLILFVHSMRYDLHTEYFRIDKANYMSRLWYIYLMVPIALIIDVTRIKDSHK